MKHFIHLLFFSIILLSADTVIAQTQQPAAPVTVPNSTPEVLPESSTESLVILNESVPNAHMINANGRTYMIIDGHKVFVDSNGVQSLSAPVEASDVPKQPTTKEQQNPEN